MDGKGIKPNPNKVHAVTHFPPPTSIKGLQEFAGMINFYHRFIPQVARIMSPVYQTLASKPKELFWTPELTEAFQQAKLALAKATLLHHPEPNAQISVSVDASDKAVGGVLEQLTKGKWQPLAFFSKQLRKPETKYSRPHSTENSSRCIWPYVIFVIFWKDGNSRFSQTTSH